MEETQKSILSETQEQDLFNQAINTALETELAFKLMSFRLTDKEQYIKRVAQLSQFFNEYYNKTTDNGTAEFSIKTSGNSRRNEER